MLCRMHTWHYFKDQIVSSLSPKVSAHIYRASNKSCRSEPRPRVQRFPAAPPGSAAGLPVVCSCSLVTASHSLIHSLTHSLTLSVSQSHAGRHVDRYGSTHLSMPDHMYKSGYFTVAVQKWKAQLLASEPIPVSVGLLSSKTCWQHAEGYRVYMLSRRAEAGVVRACRTQHSSLPDEEQQGNASDTTQTSILETIHAWEFGCRKT